MMYFSSHYKNAHRGFVALFATLIATVILILIIGATRIAYKELLLSSSARESERAFFAADTGVECGLYLDRIQNIFTTGPGGGVSCGDIGVSIDFGDPNLFDVSTDTLACARVSVDKTYDIDGVSFTQVVSRGYNVACEDLDTASVSRTVERKLEVTYPNPVIGAEGGGDTGGGDTGGGDTGGGDTGGDLPVT